MFCGNKNTCLPDGDGYQGHIWAIVFYFSIVVTPAKHLQHRHENEMTSVINCSLIVGTPYPGRFKAQWKTKNQSSKFSEKSTPSLPSDSFLVRMGVTVPAQVTANPKDTHIQAISAELWELKSWETLFVSCSCSSDSLRTIWAHAGRWALASASPSRYCSSRALPEHSLEEANTFLPVVLWSQGQHR